MKTFIVMLCLVLMLSGCFNSEADLIAIKIFDSEFNMALEANDKQTIKHFTKLFSQRVEEQGYAPNFKYLIELQSTEGTERWRYSSEGFLMKYSQEDQRIFAVINSDEFNQLVNIESHYRYSRF